MALPSTIRIARVRLAVSSLERSQQFYQTVLGFHLLPSPKPNLAQLTASGSGEVLLELEEQPSLEPLGERRRLGLYHFAILLPDRPSLGSFATHIRRLGYPAGDADHLVSEAFYLLDPDGLSVEVYADRPRSTWPYRGAELRMATDPIAMDELLRIGSRLPWSCLPSGTTLGHMHFYVNDLETAAGFYLALGFEPTVSSYPGALFLSAGGYHHHVGLNTWLAGSPLSSETDPRLLFWELRFPDEGSRDQAATRLYSAGFSTTDPWSNTVLLSGEG